MLVYFSFLLNFPSVNVLFVLVFSNMGYRFTDNFVATLVAKYDPRTRNRLTLDNFILACVQVKNLTDAFKARDTNMSGSINIAYEDFLTCVFQSV